MPKPKKLDADFMGRLSRAADELAELCGELDEYTRSGGTLELDDAENTQRRVMRIARDAAQTAMRLYAPKDIARSNAEIARLQAGVTVKP